MLRKRTTLALVPLLGAVASASTLAGSASADCTFGDLGALEPTGGPVGVVLVDRTGSMLTPMTDCIHNVDAANSDECGEYFVQGKLGFGETPFTTFLWEFAEIPGVSTPIINTDCTTPYVGNEVPDTMIPRILSGAAEVDGVTTMDEEY